MALRTVVLLADYVKEHPEYEGKEISIPKDCVCFDDVVYEDGSPVFLKRGEPVTIKVGKRKYLNLIFEPIKS